MSRDRGQSRDLLPSKVPFQAGYDACHFPLSCVAVLLLRPVCKGTGTVVDGLKDAVKEVKVDEAKLKCGNMVGVDVCTAGVVEVGEPDVEPVAHPVPMLTISSVSVMT
jgi:hypothetical protein